MDCSLPGSSVHEIFQARVLEWGAIAFSIFREVLRSRTMNKNASEIVCVCVCVRDIKKLDRMGMCPN